MGVGVEKEVLGVVPARDAALVLGVVAGTEHDVHLVRHRDVAHAADGAPGVAVVHVAVGAAFEQVFVIFDVVRVEVRRAREVAHFGTDAVEIALGVLEFVEHVAGDHLYRTDTFEVVAQPFENEGRDHFALAHPAVAVDFDDEDAAVVLFDEEQRAVTRNTADLLDLLVDDGEPRFLDVAEVVGFGFERRDDRLDVARGAFDVEVADLRERDQFFGRTEQRNDVGHEITDVVQTDVFRVVEPVVVGQILEIAFLEDDQFFDDAVLDDLASVVVRVHVGHEAGETVV